MLVYIYRAEAASVTTLHLFLVSSKIMENCKKLQKKEQTCGRDSEAALFLSPSNPTHLFRAVRFSPVFE